MLQFGPKNDVISKKKKRSSPKLRFLRPKLGDLQKKEGSLGLHMLTFLCHFDRLPLKLTGSLKPPAFLKPMGPGVIVPRPREELRLIINSRDMQQTWK